MKLPNIADTSDPVVKKLIQAVQELADQSSTFDTVIFNEMHDEIKDMRQEMKTGFEQKTEALHAIGQAITEDFDKQTQTIGEKLDDMHETLKMITKNTEH